jgi:hypothetical protein
MTNFEQTSLGCRFSRRFTILTTRATVVGSEIGELGSVIATDQIHDPPVKPKQRRRNDCGDQVRVNERCG